MSNPYESPTSESSGNVEPTPTRGTYHLGRTLAVLTFVEIFLAMLLAPADNGRWIGYATAAIVLANGLIYVTQYVPYRLRHVCRSDHCIHRTCFCLRGWHDFHSRFRIAALTMVTTLAAQGRATWFLR